jgi:diguanylate cyclase (GGDEF)-like protein/PAS domain S-box-containing protein
MVSEEPSSDLRCAAVIEATFLDLIPDAIAICDASGVIRQVNRHFSLMFEYAPEECLGNSVELLMPIHLRERHKAHRADYQRVPRTRAMNEKQTFVGTAKSGRQIPIDIMLTPVPQGSELFFMAVIRDMTKQKRLELELAKQCAELEQSQAALTRQNVLFDTALNNMTHGLVMFDAMGCLLVCNSKFREIYGIPETEHIIGASWDELLALLLQTGLIAEENRIQQLRDRRLALRAAKETALKLTLRDGRTIAISHRKMDAGGCVAVHRDITSRLRAEAEIHRLATHDFLTGLPNRLSLEQQTNSLRRARRFGGLLALHYLDLDRFKQVNDNFGHRYGDLLLQSVAARLSQIVPPDDLIARLGGDEFVILQPNVPSETVATGLATRIVADLSEPFRLNGRRVEIGASVGLAFTTGAPLLPELLRQADLALYEAKQDGKGLVRIFASGQLTYRHRSSQIEKRLAGAIARNEMTLHFQPIVNSRSCEIVAFEALLRWFQPQLGEVGPSEFIPIAERNGSIISIGSWALEKACRWALKWPSHLRLAVNVSPLQFSQPDFVGTVKDILNRTGLPGHRLDLEVTESCLFLRDESVIFTLTSLREMGIRISADDFGTGYSSLHQLKNFPFDIIKIDRSFVSGDTTKSAEIVRAITGLGKGLGMKTIAEGVETREQHLLVTSAGCEEIQGHLVSTAMAPEMVPVFLKSRKRIVGAA